MSDRINEPSRDMGQRGRWRARCANWRQTLEQYLRVERDAFHRGAASLATKTGAREASRSGLSCGKGRPADERGRAPAGLSPCDAALAILRAVVARFGRACEKCAIFECIDIDDAPYPVPIGQSHRDIDAAPPTDNLLGRSQTERVSLKLLRIGRRQRHTRLGVGKRPRVVLATERALARAEHLFVWRPVGRQLHANRTTVTLAPLEDHARPQTPSSEHFPGFETRCARSGGS